MCMKQWLWDPKLNVFGTVSRVHAHRSGLLCVADNAAFIGNNVSEQVILELKADCLGFYNRGPTRDRRLKEARVAPEGSDLLTSQPACYWSESPPITRLDFTGRIKYRVRFRSHLLIAFYFKTKFRMQFF